MEELDDWVLAAASSIIQELKGRKGLRQEIGQMDEGELLGRIKEIIEEKMDEEGTDAAKLYAFQELYWDSLFACEDCGWEGRGEDALVDTDVKEADERTNNLYCPKCFDVITPA